MTATKTHRVLVACDDSPAAAAALTAAVEFPWPASAAVRAVVARFPWLGTDAHVERAAQRSDAAADAARHKLRHRWRDPEIAIVDEPPVDAILSEARRYEATVLVIGCRGHGTFKRMLIGSVSRMVVPRAECPVVVVSEPPRALHRFLVGYDGSPNAERAIDFMCSLEPDSMNRAVLVTAVEPLPLPASLLRVPGPAREQIRHAAASIEGETYREAESALETASARLRRHGWKAMTEVLTGAPLDCLERKTVDWSADVVVVGARAVSGIQRALLGSVADGILDRSRLPVVFVS